MLCLVIKLQLRKKLVHLALLGNLHVIIYLFNVSFGSSFVTYHKSRLLRKDFFWQRRFSSLSDVFISGKKSVLHVISFFFHIKHESDSDAAVLSRELYNGFDPGLRCRKQRPILVIARILV